MSSECAKEVGQPCSADPVTESAGAPISLIERASPTYPNTTERTKSGVFSFPAENDYRYDQRMGRTVVVRICGTDDLTFIVTW
jgi:hypothetical protein